MVNREIVGGPRGNIMQSGKQMHDSPERDAPIFCCCYEASRRPVSFLTTAG